MEGCLEPATSGMRKTLTWDPITRYSSKITPKWCIFWFFVVFNLGVQIAYFLGQIGFLMTCPPLDIFSHTFGIIMLSLFQNGAYIVIIYKQKSWASIVEELQNLANEVFHRSTPVQKEVLKKLCKRYHVIGSTVRNLALYVGLVYLAVIFIQYLANPKQSFPLISLLYVPFELNTTWRKFAVSFVTVHASILSICWCSSINCFIISLLLFIHLCFFGLCENLKVVPLSKDQKNSNKKIIKLIEIHQKLCRLCAELEIMMNGLILIRILSVLLASSLIGLLVFVDLKANIRQITVPMSELLHLLTLCWVGNLVSTQSEEMLESAYFMLWTDAQTSTKKIILILMTRCRKAVKLTAGKFCSLSLETYVGVLKTSMSYLTVLRNLQMNSKS